MQNETNAAGQMGDGHPAATSAPAAPIPVALLISEVLRMALPLLHAAMPFLLIKLEELSRQEIARIEQRKGQGGGT